MQALVSNAEQGTEQWFVDRIGYITASNVADVMAGGSGAMRANHMVRMICEILSGVPVTGYKSSHMDDGNTREAIARRAYEMDTEQRVVTTGFWYLPDEKIGASSDGLVGDDGLIEIKNVLPAEQVKTITKGTIKGNYIKQMQTQMYVLDRKWCDFVSLSLGDDVYGRLPEHLKYYKIRVERDDKMIAEIRQAAAKFHQELAELLEALKNL